MAGGGGGSGARAWAFAGAGAAAGASTRDGGAAPVGGVAVASVRGKASGTAVGTCAHPASAEAAAKTIERLLESIWLRLVTNPAFYRREA
jgi:hypothetical protein